MRENVPHAAQKKIRGDGLSDRAAELIERPALTQIT
jgi:hypothetical protein